MTPDDVFQQIAMRTIIQAQLRPVSVWVSLAVPLRESPVCEGLVRPEVFVVEQPALIVVWLPPWTHLTLHALLATLN